MPWTSKVVRPRAARGEKYLYVRAWRTVGGRVEEKRWSTGTLDPLEAELERVRVTQGLDSGGGQLGVLGAMDARIADLAADRAKSRESVTGFQNARNKLAEALGDVQVDRPTLLVLRDSLQRAGLGAETINTYLRKAAASWRWAEERGMVSSPWPRLRALKKPPRKKRPYTPAEVEAVLAWSCTYAGGRWAGALYLIAETGRRVSEVCRLQGRDVDRADRTVRVRKKGGDPLVLPISEQALALVPAREPEEWLFPAKRERRRGSGWGPIRRDSVLGVVRKAVVALAIPDGERLDTHSFRRAFVADASRAGVPDDVARRLTGHETPAMLAHYQRDAVGDDLRAAAEKVRAYRAERSQPPRTSQGSAPDSEPMNDESRASSAASTWGYHDSNVRPRPYQVPHALSSTDDSARAPAWKAREVDSTPPRTPALPSQPSRALRRVFTWAGADPAAMRLLLEDDELRRQVRAALDELAPGEADERTLGA